MNFLIIVSFLLISGFANAQDTWDLSKCIDHALKNNLQIKQQEMASKIADEDYLASKGAVLPTLNALATHTYNFGQTIDPFTNQFASSRVQSNSFALSANITLFNGLQQWNAIKRTQFLAEAGKSDIEQLKNDISMSVATGYLQELYAEDLLTTMQNQELVTKNQLERLKKLEQAGKIAKSSVLDIEAQLAAEELNTVNATNQLSMARLTLRQLLDLPSDADIRLARPKTDAIGTDEILNTPGQIYEVAKSTLPGVKSTEWRLQSSEKTLAMARGGYFPILSLSGSYGSGYSGLQQEVTGVNLTGVDSIGYTSDLKTVYVPKYTTETRLKSFSDQINDNLNQTIGFRLTVPIFNGLQVKTNVNKAKISREKADLDATIYKNQLRKNIEQAHNDAIAALKKHEATGKALTALNESFRYMQQRLDAGLVTSVEFSEAKNKLIKAETDLLQAKYDYIFKTRVLDFYMGKPLQF